MVKANERLEKAKEVYFQMKRELESANARLDIAKELLNESKEEVQLANLRAKTKIYKDLQISRDRLYIAIEALVADEPDINCAVASLLLCVETMQKCDMWKDVDPLPQFDRDENYKFV